MKKNAFIFLPLLLVFVLIFININKQKLSGSAINSDMINNINIGDKINLEINDIKDWEVLSIDKDNNTIEVVSSNEVEKLRLKGYSDWKESSNILKQIAEKYSNNKYVIETRNLSIDDLNENITKKGCFWIDKTDSETNGINSIPNSYLQYYYCEDEKNFNKTSLMYADLNHIKFLIMITLNEPFASKYNIGDDYNYSSNNINKWKVLNINNDSIDIIAEITPKIDLILNSKVENNFINEYLSKFKNDNTKDVRLVNFNDSENLIKAGYKDEKIKYISNYNGIINEQNWDDTYDNGYETHQYETINFWDKDDKYLKNTIEFEIYSIEYGVRPVLKLKFNNDLIKYN